MGCNVGVEKEEKMRGEGSEERMERVEEMSKERAWWIREGEDRMGCDEGVEKEEKMRGNKR